MLDSYRLETVDQLKAISKPIRWRMLVLLIENPMTGSQLARALDIPRNTAHYHLHILEEAGLVTFEEERLNSGLVEHYYRAIAHIFLSDHFFTKEIVENAEEGKIHRQDPILQSYLLGILEQ
ncbi:MAG: helix-turn-helix domain-containing protein, partial [Anaerolineaceae bacterium]